MTKTVKRRRKDRKEKNKGKGKKKNGGKKGEKERVTTAPNVSL